MKQLDPLTRGQALSIILFAAVMVLVTYFIGA